MKIIFEYVFRDVCYGDVEITNERYAEAEVDGYAEVELPPCSKKVKVTLKGCNAFLQFADSGEVTATFEKQPFSYSESYELFEDVRDMELEGRVWLEDRTEGQ